MQLVAKVICSLAASTGEQGVQHRLREHPLLSLRLPRSPPPSSHPQLPPRQGALAGPPAPPLPPALRHVESGGPVSPLERTRRLRTKHHGGHARDRAGLSRLPDPGVLKPAALLRVG